MDLFKWFKKEPATVPAAQEYPTPALALPGTIMLKPMKWVVNNGKVCIVTEVDSSGYVGLAIVNAEGATTGYARVHAGNIRLARLAEIPESRRPTNPAYAATLGYV